MRSTPFATFSMAPFILILAATVFLPLPPLFAQSSHSPQTRLITSRDGLPQAFVPGLAQDKTGFIWIATRDGLARYDGRGFRVFRHRNDNPESISDNVIYWMEQLPDDKLLIYSEKGDLDLFDPITERFTHLSQEPYYPRLLFNDIYSVARDGSLWTISAGQLTQIDWKKKRTIRIPIPELKQRKCGQLLVGRDKRVYIVTDKGLYQYDLKHKTGAFYRDNTPLNARYLPLQMGERPNGEILIGQDHALVIFNPQTQRFRRQLMPDSGNVYPIKATPDGSVYVGHGSVVYRLDPSDSLHVVRQGTTVDNRFYRSILIDETGLVWLGTDAEGIQVVNQKPLPFQPRPYQKGFLDDLFRQVLGVNPPVWEKWAGPYTLKYSTDSRGNGWFLNSPSLMKFNLATRQIERKNWQQFLPPNKRDIGIGCFHLRSDGTLWLLAENYLIKTDTALAKGQTIALPLERNRLLNDILLPGFSEIAEVNGKIYMATVEGLVVADPTGQKSLEFIRSKPGAANSLSSDNLVSLCQDPFQPTIFWIGTLGGGLNRYDTQTKHFQLFTESDGLPNGTIYTILPDQKGFLWISTNKGICRFDPRTGQTRNFTAQDGLQDDEFNRFHRAVLPDGRFLMAGISGMTVFDPLKLEDQVSNPVPAFVSLKIGNVLITGTLADSLKIPPLNTANELRLRHHQNFLTFEFGVLEYENPQKVQYRYRLLGAESDWVMAGTQNTANYTSLEPGAYRFEINATNLSGAWSRSSRQLTIVISPPWWATIWAYLGYGLVIVGAIWFGVRTYLNRLKMQQDALLKAKEAKQLRELDEMKTRFFSNITHEFRTPLTLILSPVEQMIRENRESKDRRKLVSVEKNANQLLGLINQLMDLTKLESKAMTVREARGNLSTSLKQWLQPFESQAGSKQIRLEFTTEIDEDFWFDAEKLERIITNLVSNAVKFTNPNGQITVHLSYQAKTVQLTISDTGTGIGPDALPHIFDRFFQWSANAVDDSSVRRQEGTGIGLALVKELVDVQRGRIEVESIVGIGTTFILHLPYRPALPITTETVPEISIQNSKVESSQRQSNEAVSILLVEDNTELGDFIADSLPSEYRIHRAYSGIEGVEQATNLMPDLIISDVLMPVQAGPEMDGFTLCHTLKTDFRTSHIPIILLTAKASLDSRLEGLSRGADDYVTKPFHVQELLLRIRNLLDRQQKLSEWIRGNLTSADQSQVVVPPDDPFLSKVYSQLDAKLDDATYGVEELATDIGVGRYTFLRKAKALTAMPPNELIRNYRLKRSLHYLRQGYSIAETSTLVGFENPSYFSKCFRDLYKLTPTEVAKQN